MSMRRLAGLMLLPVAVWAQQRPKQVPASVPSISSKSNAVIKTASQILDENRGSIAVIVAAGNTSLKLGTGFFIRSTGLLLTNFHVVEGMDLVGVKIPGRDEVLWAKKATGFDLDNDLVLLEVETTGTKPVSLGDSDHARVGEQIVVVGNPEGLEQTVSNGLLSGIRELDGRQLFQISAPISEGSSGSPVFNTSGDVIAVRLTVTGSDWKYLLIEDPIPAGTEFIERDNLYALRDRPPWWQYFYARREFHDDHAALFQTYFDGRESRYFYLLKIVNPGKFRKVGICHLPMAENPVERHVAVSDRVRPKFVALAVLQRIEDCSRIVRGLPFADEQSQQAALGDRAGREAVAGVGEPFLGRVVIHVIGDNKGDENVRVEQRRHCSSSSARTSSVLMTLPRLTTGSPVLGLRDGWDDLPWSIPRRISSATISLSVRDVSRAIDMAWRCRSSGRSIVVRTLSS